MDNQSITGMMEEINEESNKRRWKTKAEKDYEEFVKVLRKEKNKNEEVSTY